ncbi:MAG TPA: hypothetical protein VK135_04535 [Candidatus Dormibacteraeota bacterium]|nr:hypothetical protein [Candidatus Dormibacteraeota bacterium]
MPKIFIHISFFFFMITALSGLLMRVTPFVNLSFIPYGNVLHAHSHIAILGWAFLGSFLILLAVLWPSIKNKLHSILLTITLSITSVLMFIAFLIQGYGLYSIILSTIHIFIEYWAIIFIYQQLKIQKRRSSIGTLFIKGSLITLFISSLGPFILAYISANQLQDSVLFDMAIYFYLHFQYNGWLTLFLIGTFLLILGQHNIHPQVPLLKRGFWIYFIALFPWYFNSILWIDLGAYSNIFAMFGSIGQWIGIFLMILGIGHAWVSYQTKLSKLTMICLTITFILLCIKSTMELGLIFPSLASLVYETRSVIIGYLHLTLLGFISFFILSQYQMIKTIAITKKVVYISLIIFFSGFILNELLLFTMGLASWLELTPVPYYFEGLLIASLLLTIGIGTLWYSILKYDQSVFTKLESFKLPLKGREDEV